MSRVSARSWLTVTNNGDEDVMAGTNCSECAGNVVEGAVTGKHDGPDPVHHERDRAFRGVILAEH